MESALKQRLRRIYPILVISLGACFLVYKYLLQVSPGVMTQQLMRSFHVHAAGLGNLAAMFFYAYLFTQMFVGVLLDKYSVRWFVTFALLVSACGAFLFSNAHSLLIASIARLLMGMGAAFATVSYMKLASQWFKPERFAFVGGLLATAVMVGAVVGEAPLAELVKFEGWRDGMMLAGWLGVIIAIVFFFVVPDSSKAPLATKSISPVNWPAIKKLVRNPQNWLLTLYSGLAFSPAAVFAGLWGNPFLEDAHHYSTTSAAALISTVFVGLAVGGPVLGILSDYLRKRRVVMMLGTTVALISLLAVIYWDGMPLWANVTFLFIFGFGTGAFMLGFVVGKEMNALGLAATVIALINTGDAIFGAISEPLVGKFLDWGWRGHEIKGAHIFSIHDYHMAFLLLPAYLVVALVVLCFIKER